MHTHTYRFLCLNIGIFILKLNYGCILQHFICDYTQVPTLSTYLFNSFITNYKLLNILIKYNIMFNMLNRY